MNPRNKGLGYEFDRQFFATDTCDAEYNYKDIRGYSFFSKSFKFRNLVNNGSRYRELEILHHEYLGHVKQRLQLGLDAIQLS